MNIPNVAVSYVYVTPFGYAGFDKNINSKKKKSGILAKLTII